jgi:hypothetical protein
MVDLRRGWEEGSRSRKSWLIWMEVVAGMQSVVAGRRLDRERGARWALALVSVEDDATI